MKNKFVEDLILKLDTKYDAVIYDETCNTLKVMVYKTTNYKDLMQIMKDLDEEVPYHNTGFHSNPERYVFTYQIKPEKMMVNK